jgi:hypothetical protein
MASLEYLTQNSLTAYPFKPRRPTTQATAHPIADDWFCDILFTSFVASARTCYISSIEKTSDARLLIVLNNAETETSYAWIDSDTEELTSTIVIASDDLVNHLDNKSRSFASHKNSLFAVKFVFGPGLINYPTFSQVYQPGEAELANGTITLAPPKVAELTFENYVRNQNNTNPYQISKAYTAADIPEVQGRYNVTIPLGDDGAAGINVEAEAGFGLFNTCVPAGLIDEVYSLNSIQPTQEGKFFIAVDQCYSLNVLNSSEKIILGNSLDKYEPFKLYNPSGSPIDFNFATTSDNTLVLTNFCKPKCPPENIKAFAHYLNRVIDGATDLSSAITRSKETRGKGGANLRTFTATEFCSDENSPFLRCAEPTSPQDSYITCNESFIKYYHEFRKLQIFYNNGEVYTFTILEVIDDNTVYLDSLPPAATEPKYFRVVDNGVVSDFNCVIQEYNKNALEFKQPYFKVIHTTSESSDAKGAVITLVSIAVAIFNPSNTTTNFLVNFAVNSKLTQEGKFKIRKEAATYFSETPTATTQCLEYAFVEAIFAMPCGENGGNVDISVFKTQGAVTTQVGNTHNIPNISATQCFESTFIEQKIRITQSTFSNFSYSTELPAGVTELSTLYYAPPWLKVAFLDGQTVDQSRLTVVPGYPAPETNQLFDGLYSAKTSNNSYLYKLVLDYVASPVITYPLTGDFTSEDPLLFVPGNTYTANNPLLIVTAQNMRSVSANFPGDVYSYTLVNSVLPEGLTLASSLGIITGTVPANFNEDQPISVTISAINPAGSSTVSSTIFLMKHMSTAVPVISFLPAPDEPVFSLNNATRYTSSGDSKVFSISATNIPILSYRLSGDNLPSGLFFNQATGTITGKLSDFSAQTTSHTIYASNAAGESSGLDFTLNYTIYTAPEITHPTTLPNFELNATSETTAENPLIVISSTQLFGGTDNYAEGLTDQTRNNYSFISSPPGFVIEKYTGKVYGKISIPVTETKYYSALVSVTNPVGVAYVYIAFVFAAPGVPVVKNIGSVVVVKNNLYTAQSPLFTIEATNQPTSFAATGLPTGLSCTTSGKIVGTVNNQVEAGTYFVACAATNQYGTSLSETISVISRISLVYPIPTDLFTLSKNQNYSNVFTVVHSGVKSGDTAIVTLTGIPEGLSFVNNKLSGTPSADYSGSMRLLITTTNYSYDYLDIPIEVVGVPYEVTGVVKDALTNLPVAGVLIRATATRTATTNQLGEYTILLSSGVYSLTASKPDYVFSPPSIYTQVNEAPVSGQIFKGLSEYRGISGYIKTSSLTPVSFVSVSDGVSTTTTSSTGFYQLFSPIAQVTITPQAAGKAFSPPSRIISAGEFDETNVDFTSATANTVSGWITDGSQNQHLQGAVVVTALNTDTNHTYTINLNEGASSPALFVFSLPAGPYTITAYSENYIFAPTQIITSISSNSSSNNFSGYVAGTISGQIVLAASDHGVQIPVRASIVSTIITGGLTFTTLTNAHGLFSFQIPYGTSFLTAKFNLIDVAPALSATSPSSGVQFSPYVTTISGNVTYNSESSAGATLTLTFIDSSSVLRETTSTTEGYTIRSVPAGNYKIKPYKKGFSFTPSDLELIVAGTAPVTSKNFTIAINGITPTAPSIIAHKKLLTAIIVEFNPPSDTPDTGEIIGYKYSIDGGSNYTAALPSQFVTPTKIQITQLTQDTEYIFKLKAYNLAGDGLASGNFIVRTARPPAAPENLQVSAVGSTLSLDFEPGDNGGADIVNYEYRRSLVEVLLQNAPWLSGGTTSPPVQVTNLIGGVVYYLQVRAISEASAGAESAIVSILTNSEPAAPELTLHPIPGVGIRATFYTPLDGGLPVTSYKISVDNVVTVILLEDLTENVPENPDNPVTYNYDITGLITGRAYSVKLKAINSFGESLWATPNPFTVISAPNWELMPNAVPFEPVVSSGKIIVTFRALDFTPEETPSNGGSLVSEYIVEAYLMAGDAAKLWYPAEDYQIGDIVVDFSGGGPPIFFRCVTAHTSELATAPPGDYFTQVSPDYIAFKSFTVIPAPEDVSSPTFTGGTVSGLENGVYYRVSIIARKLINEAVPYYLEDKLELSSTYTPNISAPLSSIDLVWGITTDEYGGRKIYFNTPNFDDGGAPAQLAVINIRLGVSTSYPLTDADLPIAQYSASISVDLSGDYSGDDYAVALVNSIGFGPQNSPLAFISLEEAYPQAPPLTVSYTQKVDLKMLINFSVGHFSFGVTDAEKVVITLHTPTDPAPQVKEYYSNFFNISDNFEYVSLNETANEQFIITARAYSKIGAGPATSLNFNYILPPFEPQPTQLQLGTTSDTTQDIFISFYHSAYIDAYPGNGPLTSLDALIYSSENILEEEINIPIFDLESNLQNLTNYVFKSYAPIITDTYKNVAIKLTNSKGSLVVPYNNLHIWGKPFPPAITVEKPAVGQLVFNLSASPNDPTSPNQTLQPQINGSPFVDEQASGYIVKDDNYIHNSITPGQPYDVGNGANVTIFSWWYHQNYKSDLASLQVTALNYPNFNNGTLTVAVRKRAFKMLINSPPICGGCACIFRLYVYLSTTPNVGNLTNYTVTWGAPDPAPHAIIETEYPEYLYFELDPTSTNSVQAKFILEISNCVFSPPAESAYDSGQRLLKIDQFVSSTNTNAIPLAPVIYENYDPLPEGGGIQLVVNILSSNDRNIAIAGYQYKILTAAGESPVTSTGAWINVAAADISSYDGGANLIAIKVRNFSNWIPAATAIRAVTSTGGAGDPSRAIKFTPSGPPGAPVVSQQDAIHEDKLPVNFQLGAQRGPLPIIKYQYTTNSGSATPIWMDVQNSAFPPAAAILTGSPATATSLNIFKQSDNSALVLGTVYSVKIRAVSSLGSGTSSNAVNFVASMRPFKITQVTYTPSASRILSVIITFAGNGGAAISKYYWTLNGNDPSPTWISVTTTSQTGATITINNWSNAQLVNGTQYAFRVYAENIAGTGEISDTFIMIPSTIPNAPTITSLTSLNNVLRVMYNPPAFDGGNSIKNYSYSIDDGIVFIPTLPANGSPPYIDIPDLINNEYYIVKIRAINDRGAGSISNYKIGAPKA